MNHLLLTFKKMDNSILALMKSGLKFCFAINLISTIILLTYDFIYTIPLVYYVGISLFKSSLFFMTFFVIFSLAFSKIKGELKS